MTLGRALLPAVAAISAVAGVVHAGVARHHMEESSAHGAFFVVVAAAQLAWAAAVWGRRPSPALLGAGVAGNAAVVALWAVSRATGAEPVGPADVVATTAELALVTAGSALVARPSLAVPLPPGGWWTSPLASGVCAAVLGLAALAVTPVRSGSTGEVHGHDGRVDAAAPGPTGGAAAHAHGVTAGEDEAPPTPAQRAAADTLVADTRAAVARFADLDEAVAAGYRPITPAGERIVHYGKPAYILDGDVLDHQRVESLVYARTGRGPVLLGAMYMMPPGQRGPAVGGSLTRWHAHDDLCIDEAQLAQVARRADGSCPPGSAVRVTPEMLHVWVVDYPTGPFGELTPLDALQVLLALER